MALDLHGMINSAVKGFIGNNSPSIVRGFMIQWLKQSKVTPQQLEMLVLSKKRLWPLIPERYYPGLRNMLREIGDISWLTSEWLIENGKADFPVLASFFLGWRKARNWLDLQVEDCRQQLEKLREQE